MTRGAYALPLVLSIAACGRSEPTSSSPPPTLEVPPMPASASAAPSASAVPPEASASASTSVSASASASPAPAPLPGFPPADLACAKDADCQTAFFDDACCSQCEPRLGNAKWVKKVTAFCTAPGRAKGCAPSACSWAFGRPACVNGTCRLGR